MITEINGDVFKSKDDILIHGCNCYNTMGAGVAYKVQLLYPLAQKADLNSKLGTYTYSIQKHHYYPEQNITVINAYTQYEYSWGAYKNSVVDYDAIKTVMKSIKKRLSENVYFHTTNWRRIGWWRLEKNFGYN